MSLPKYVREMIGLEVLVFIGIIVTVPLAKADNLTPDQMRFLKWVWMAIAFVIPVWQCTIGRAREGR